jgi:UDP-4-amino-4-deoxy-L-arabinose-oxoglutarate aminotransferase
MPTYVCDAVSAAIHATGATAVLCDVERDRCVSRANVEPHLTDRTAAVVVVHTFGAVADVAPIAALGVPVIEDCCQAFLAQSTAGTAGTIGDACVLSFHATKLLTTGEGGMALSTRPEVSARLDEFRRDTPSAACRRVAPLADVQAALGLSQLAKYDEFLRRRRTLADRYFTALSGVKTVQLPDDVRGRSLFYRFAVRCSRPFAAISDAFMKEGVIVRRGVDALMHQRLRTPGSFAVAEQLFAETVSLPLYPSLTDAEADHVLSAARRVFEAC